MDPILSQESDDFEIILEPNNIESEPRLSLLSVGCVISDKIVNVTAVLAQLCFNWSTVEAPSIKSFGGNLYGVYFANRNCLESGLEDSPYIVYGCCFHLQRWSIGKAYDEIDFSKVPFWIQIHKFPIELLSNQNARLIGSRIRDLVKIEDPFEDEIGRGFLRIRVILDIKKPILSRFWIPRADGSRSKAFLKYEKLQDFCFGCGKLGHSLKSCVADPVMRDDEDGPEFGIHMHAPTIKYSMVVRWRVEEAATHRPVENHMRSEREAHTPNLSDSRKGKGL